MVKNSDCEESSLIITQCEGLLPRAGREGGSRNIWAGVQLLVSWAEQWDWKILAEVFYQHVVGRRAHDSENLVFMNH